MKRIGQIQPLDQDAMARAQQHWDSLAKPIGSLGRLEEIVIQLCGIECTSRPARRRTACIVFCGDHGITAEGVAQSDAHVTAAVAEHLLHGKTALCALARQYGAQVFPVDVGMAETVPGVENRKIAPGTGNILHEPAMTRAQAAAAVAVGIDLAGEKKNAGYNLLTAGEMGIGNTSAAALMLAALTGAKTEDVTGRGAGLSDNAFVHKKEVLRQAFAARQPDGNDVMDVLSKVGGYELCAMTGLFIGGGVYRVPVIADGFLSVVSALCALRLAPAVRGFLFPSHSSGENGTRIALAAAGLRPYLDLDMRLGEGTGAILAAGLIQAALCAYTQTVPFAQTSVAQYTKY